MTSDVFEYDEVPYPSYTFLQTHPDRLSTLGALFGIDTAHPEKCRVLELGCGDGTNLLSFAYALPKSTFTGVDLSQIHIDRAKAAASTLGLPNLSFVQADVTTMQKGDLGEFDFIIAHGLFSWIPESVRPHVLRIYSECLAPEGIGYISYNTFPGCHIRRISSDIMKYGARSSSTPMAMVETGKAFLDSVAAAADPNSLYQMMLRAELSQIVERSDQNVFHDDLSPMNRPFYFHEMEAMLNENGLKFVCEADAAASNPFTLQPAAREMLKSAGEDIGHREQLIDFFTCRRFRRTVICRADKSTPADMDQRSLKRFYVAGNIDADLSDHDLTVSSPLRFTAQSGTSVDIDHPLTKAALVHLRRVYARNVAFKDLITEAGKLIGAETVSVIEADRTESTLSQCYLAEMVTLHRYQPRFMDHVSERPEASRFSRWQIQNGCESITTLTGMNLRPDNPATAALLSLLDGTRTSEELVKEMKLSLQISDDERERFEEMLPASINIELLNFARAGLLIA